MKRRARRISRERATKIIGRRRKRKRRRRRRRKRRRRRRKRKRKRKQKEKEVRKRKRIRKRKRKRKRSTKKKKKKYEKADGNRVQKYRKGRKVMLLSMIYLSPFQPGKEVKTSEQKWGACRSHTRSQTSDG